MSAIIVHSTGTWEVVFYFFGCMSIVWFFVFVSQTENFRASAGEIKRLSFQILLCYRSPVVHPFIHNGEKVYLEHEISEMETINKSHTVIPWRAMLVSPPVIVLALIHVSCERNLSRFTIRLFMAMIENLGVRKTGCARLGLLHHNDGPAEILERRAARLDPAQRHLLVDSASRRADIFVFRRLSVRLYYRAERPNHHQREETVRFYGIIHRRSVFTGRLVRRV